MACVSVYHVAQWITAQCVCTKRWPWAVAIHHSLCHVSRAVNLHDADTCGLRTTGLTSRLGPRPRARTKSLASRPVLRTMCPASGPSEWRGC
eukprot:359740-Chlamydomonas_euryale.AAC.8